jgi:hypothetical protein
VADWVDVRFRTPPFDVAAGRRLDALLDAFPRADRVLFDRVVAERFAVSFVRSRRPTDARLATLTSPVSRSPADKKVSGVERRSNKSRRTSEPYRADPVISRDRLFDG